MNPEETLKRDIFKMQQAAKEGYKVLRVYQGDVYRANDEWLEENIIAEIENLDRDHLFISMDEGLYKRHIELYSSGTPIELS